MMLANTVAADAHTWVTEAEHACPVITEAALPRIVCREVGIFHKLTDGLEVLAWNSDNRTNTHAPREPPHGTMRWSATRK